jgi:hypothetical protein
VSLNLDRAGDVSQAVSEVTPDFGEATEEGELLLAWAQSNNPSATSALAMDSTSLGNGWAQIEGTGNGYNWSGLWYKPNAGADEAAPTFLDDGYTINAGLLAFSGLTSSPLDQSGAADATDPVPASAVDTAAGDLIVALSTWNGPNADPTFSQTLYGSSGSAITTVEAQSNSGTTADSGMYYCVSYQQNVVPLGSDPNAVSVTISENEGYVSGIIASFLAA